MWILNDDGRENVLWQNWHVYLGPVLDPLAFGGDDSMSPLLLALLLDTALLRSASATRRADSARTSMPCIPGSPLTSSSSSSTPPTVEAKDDRRMSTMGLGVEVADPRRLLCAASRLGDKGSEEAGTD